MGAAVRLLVPQIPVFVTTIFFVLFIIRLEIVAPYQKYMKILKYITLSLLSYIITAIIVGGNWSQILTFSVIPHIEIKPDFATMFVAIIGSSISPYLFFWQTSEKAEEMLLNKKLRKSVRAVLE